MTPAPTPAPRPAGPPEPTSAPASAAAAAAAAAAHGPRPFRTGLGLLTPLLWVLLAALLSIGALAFALRWMLFTDEGTRWLIGHLPMVTEARGVQGALLGPSWRIEQLRAQWDQGRQWLVLEDLGSEGMVWSWRPEGSGISTLWASLDVQRLRVRRLQVETGPPGPRPIPLPANLAPPLRLAIASLEIDELQIGALPLATELAASSVIFDGQAGASHRIEQLVGRIAGLRLASEASLTNTRPFELRAQATAVPALSEVDAPPWAAVLRAAGPLAAFDLQATLRGRPPVASASAGPALDLRALVRPLEAWPVQKLTARTEALDLAAVRAGAPQTSLSGELLVQAAARNAPVTVQLRLANREPGRWNERRVPVSRIEIDARGELARTDRVEFTRFDVQLAESMRPGGTAGRADGRATWVAHQLEIETRFTELKPQKLDGRAPAMTLAGPLRLTLNGLPSPDPRVTAPPPPWAASGQLDLEGQVAGAPRPVALHAEGSASAKGLEVRQLQVRSGGALAELRASLARNATGEWLLDTQGSLAEFDPVPWWPGEPGSPWRQGPHRLNAGWQFELRAPAEAARLAPLALAQRLIGNGRLRLQDSVLAGVPLAGEATLGYSAAAAAGRAGSLRADLQFGGNRITFEGQGDPAGPGDTDRWRAEIHATALVALAALTRLDSSLASWAPRRGSVNAEISAQGRWPRVASEGQARIDDLQIGTLALRNATASWRLDLTDAAPGRAPLTFDGQANGLSLGEQRVDDVRAELRGTLADHRLELRASLPVTPGAPAERLLDIAGQGAEGSTRAHLAAQGQWLPDAGGGGRWLARIDEVDLSPGGAAAATTPSGARWAEARNLRAQLQFDAQGQLQSVSAEPGRVRLGDTFALRWDAVQVDLRRPRADFALRADIEPFALPPLLRRMQPGIGWQGDLRLSARVEVRAAERFEADVVFQRHDGDLHVETQGELQLLGLTDFRLTLKARDGLWDFEPVFNGRGLGEIRGRLRVRTTPERRWPPGEAPIEGQIQARVPDIGVWGHWVPPGWRLNGELATTAQVGGRFGEPTYTGEISGKGLGVRNLLQGVNVTDGRLLVRLAGSSAQIETFTLRGGEGRVDVTGTASLGATPSARLKIEADKFRALGRVDRMVTASGQGELALATETSRFEGRFRIDEGLFDFTRGDAPSLDEDVTMRGSEAALAAQAARDTSTGNAAAANAAAARGRPQRFVLGVDLDLGQQLRVKGRGLDTGLTGQVRITNPNNRLSVAGSIESVGGTYVAYGQKLALERGVIAFSGALDNPRLDVWAVRPNLDTRVGVQVTGPLQGLRVRLFSDPAMSETDKLSWLVLGRASEGLGRNDTALLQRAAVALLAGEGEAPTDALMRRLGIDELSLKQSDGDVRETVVSLGKQLSRRWYLGYERGVNATTGTWQLIYRAAQRFTLRMQSGLENSLDLIWTWRLGQPPTEGGVRRSVPAKPP